MRAFRITRRRLLPGILVVLAAHPLTAQRTPDDLFTEWYGPYPQTAQVWAPPVATLDNMWLAHGLSEYSRAKALDALFPDGRPYERRFFGGLVPYVIRSVPVTSERSANRVALAIGTLERHIGWATLQPALAEFAPRWRAGAARPEELAQIINRTSGRDLSWFFDQAFDPSITFDFGIERFVTQPAGNGTFRTTLVVRRDGAGTFPGTSRKPEGPFRVPGALDIVVTFGDGSQAHERWDGRDESTTFSYESRTAAVSAAVDPDRRLWLDTNRGNNMRSLHPSRRAASTWALRWLTWFEDLLLTYSYFV